MIRLDQDCEREMLSQLADLGFSSEDAKSALTDVFKVVFIRLAKEMENRLSDKEKRIFVEMAEDKSQEEILVFINRYFRDRTPLDRAEAEKILNEVWDSYLETMKAV